MTAKSATKACPGCGGERKAGSTVCWECGDRTPFVDCPADAVATHAPRDGSAPEVANVPTLAGLPVIFGGPARKSIGLVGNGRMEFGAREIILHGFAPPPLGLQMALLLGVTVVPYLAFGTALGIVPSILLIAWFRRRPFKAAQRRIPADSVAYVCRDADAIAFHCRVQGHGGICSLEFRAQDDATAYRIAQSLMKATRGSSESEAC